MLQITQLFYSNRQTHGALEELNSNMPFCYSKKKHNKSKMQETKTSHDLLLAGHLKVSLCPLDNTALVQQQLFCLLQFFPQISPPLEVFPVNFVEKQHYWSLKVITRKTVQSKGAFQERSNKRKMEVNNHTNVLKSEHDTEKVLTCQICVH